MNINPTDYHLLVVEDEAALRDLLTHNLGFEGYQVSTAEDVFIGADLLAEQKIDLILLDLMLPGKSGLEWCRELRISQSKVPIIMLTARSTSGDIVTGLRAGADDYLCKPFELMELLARIESLLRRTLPQQEKVHGFQIGSARYDARERVIYRGAERFALTAQEASLLEFLWEHRGEVLSRETIMQEVWKHDELFSYRTIDTHINRLRQKIEEKPSQPRYIL
ncbi:MAG: response regulator transcription factor, partial [Bacteroidota bacterium]